MKILIEISRSSVKEFEAPGKVRQRSLREFKENSLATCERRNWNLALNREKFKNKILIY